MDLNRFLIKNMLFPYMKIVKGNTIQQKLKYLKKSENMSIDELKKTQSEELKKLLLFCIEHVPAYKQFKNLKNEIENNPFLAIQKFPVLTKKEFSQNKEMYMPDNVDKSKCIPNHTGGSTGEPVKFYMDRETVEWYEAARYQGLSWNGIEIGDRSVMFWGSPIELNQQQSKKHATEEKILKNRVVIPAYDINPKKIQEHVEMLKKYKPDFLYGYASALYLFAKLLEESNIDLKLNIKAIISTSENLFDFQKEEIEKVFKCHVSNEYGARDGGIIAYQCPKGGIHLNILNGFYEVVDHITDKNVEEGQEGNLLVTDLHNYVMPRLRYQVGDRVTMNDSSSSCACKLNLPTLKSIDGRVDDTFKTKDGSFVHGHFFNHVFRNFNTLAQFQVVQHTPETMTIKIVKRDNYSKDEVDTFVTKIKERLGDLDIKVEYVTEIPTSKSGKMRYAIREYQL